LDPNTYKWVYGHLITMMVMLLVGYCWLKSRLLSLVLVVLISGFSFYMNFRSLAGLTLLTGLALLWSDLLSSDREKLSGDRLFVSCVFALLACFGILQFYSFAASSGLLGEESKQKYIMQAGSAEEEFSLLDGRKEGLFAVPKIIESPILGWGSWAKDQSYVKQRHRELYGSRAYLGADISEFGVIPTHSHLLTGFLEAGILGGLFWIAVLWMMIRNMVYTNILKLTPILWVLFYYESVAMVWDLLFSPFGGSRRVKMGALIALQVVFAAQLGYRRVFQVGRLRQVKF
jgi:hypothetical protein